MPLIHVTYIFIRNIQRFFIGSELKLEQFLIKSKLTKISISPTESDIALVKLQTPVEFSDVIKPIAFACSSISNDKDVIAIGNGITKDSDQTMPPILQYTQLKTMSRLSCLKSFPFLIFRGSVVCVKGEERRSACSGDSGGPLITPDNTLIGLTSFGSARGCEKGYPQVFHVSRIIKNGLKKPQASIVKTRGKKQLEFREKKSIVKMNIKRLI